MFCQNFTSFDIIDAEAVSNLNISNFLITPGSGKLIRRYITRPEPAGDIEKNHKLSVLRVFWLCCSWWQFHLMWSLLWSTKKYKNGDPELRKSSPNGALHSPFSYIYYPVLYFQMSVYTWTVPVNFRSGKIEFFAVW